MRSIQATPLAGLTKPHRQPRHSAAEFRDNQISGGSGACFAEVGLVIRCKVISRTGFGTYAIVVRQRHPGGMTSH